MLYICTFISIFVVISLIFLQRKFEFETKSQRYNNKKENPETIDNFSFFLKKLKIKKLNI